MNLKVGDVIEILHQEKDGWWYGDMGGYMGWFPSNYVTLVNSSSGGTQSSSSSGRLGHSMMVRVEYDYDAKDVDELTLKKGNYVSIIRQDDSGWWVGAIGGRVGLFPSNFVVVCEPSKPVSKNLWSEDSLETLFSKTPIIAEDQQSNEDRNDEEKEEKQRNSNDDDSGRHLMHEDEEFVCRALVLSSRAAQTNDELPLYKGDTIRVFIKGDKGWWKGESFGRRGWFPADYVTEVLDKDHLASTSPSNLKSLPEGDATKVGHRAAAPFSCTDYSPNKKSAFSFDKHELSSSSHQESDPSPLGSLEHSTAAILRSRSPSIHSHAEESRASYDSIVPESPRSESSSKQASMEMPNLLDIRKSLRPIPRKVSKSEDPSTVTDQIDGASGTYSKEVRPILDTSEIRDYGTVEKLFKDHSNESGTVHSPVSPEPPPPSSIHDVLTHIDQLRKDFENRLDQERQARRSLEDELCALRKLFLEKDL